MIDYETILTDVRETPNQDLKKIIFNMNQRDIDYIKSLDLSEDIKKILIKHVHDRNYIDTLLINAFAKDY